MAQDETISQADGAQPQSDGAWRADIRDLEAISIQVRQLVAAGAASSKASADQKFKMGDLIRNFQSLQSRVNQRAALPGSTADDASLRERFRAMDKELFKGHDVSRPTIIDWGRVAAAFPGDHPIRSRLSFSYAKTLASLDSQEERDAWYEQAGKQGLSVKALQEELSSRRGPGSAVVSVRKQSKAFVCSETGQAITDLSVMVTLIFSTASVSSVLPNRSQKSRSQKSGTTAAHSAPEARGPSSPKTLRFRDAAALMAWLEVHQRDFLKVNESSGG